MSDITIWHNPRCGKSRDAFNLLVEKGIEANVVKYLNETPSREELKEVLVKLGMQPRELMRTKEKVYKELNLANETSDEALIDAMIANPKLIERPIVIKGNKAVIGRPIENIINLIG